MSGVADFAPDHDEHALLKVDRAHKAHEKISGELSEALVAAQKKVYAQFNPIFFESQAVLYDAMTAAAKAGFTYEEMAQTMGCANH